MDVQFTSVPCKHLSRRYPIFITIKIRISLIKQTFKVERNYAIIGDLLEITTLIPLRNSKIENVVGDDSIVA